MCYTPGIFDNIFRWHFCLFFEIDISMIFRGHKLLAAIKYLNDKKHRFGKIKGKGVIDLNCPYPM